MIAIIDYGMGNLYSVSKALSFLGGRVQITSDPRAVGRAKALVFPGVGAFAEAMGELKRRRLVEPIVGSIREDKPFLGLCLGLQLLFASSEESPGVKGLGVLPGRVRRLPRSRNLKVPHMGWNQIETVKSEKLRVKNLLLKDVPEGAFMYFVHSFYAEPKNKETILTMTEYGCRFPSIIWNQRNLWATQFHPEKSQRWGLRILKNFLNEVASC